MSTKYDEVRGIARAALQPDFFAVRIDEEDLFPLLQELVARISVPGVHPKLATIKQLTASATSAGALIDPLKERNLWLPLRELLIKAPIA